jgi:hypothetical protein
MGLDMYAFTVDAKDAGDAVTDVAMGDNAVELFYWRKFNALHGWMEDLYRLKKGLRVSFNCTTVRLTSEDLDRLEREAGTMQPVQGSFFGAQVVYPEQLESVADFIAKAREALDYGKAVYYDSWW